MNPIARFSTEQKNKVNQLYYCKYFLHSYLCHKTTYSKWIGSRLYHCCFERKITTNFYYYYFYFVEHTKGLSTGFRHGFAKLSHAKGSDLPGLQLHLLLLDGLRVRSWAQLPRYLPRDGSLREILASILWIRYVHPKQTLFTFQKKKKEQQAARNQFLF